MMISRFRRTFIFVGFTVISYLFGAYSYSRDWFPMNILRAVKASIERSLTNDSPEAELETKLKAEFDRFGRLTWFEGKTMTDCPSWTQSTAVILAFGQSNSANAANTRIDYSDDLRILNYHDGRCYRAASPLLGATHTGGEFLTTMSAKLLESGRYSQIILVPAGVGNSAVSAWQAGRPLNTMLMDLVKELLDHYPVTHLVWHQGESDQYRKTRTWQYIDHFESMLNSIRDLGVDAPIFIALTTKCGPAPVDVDSSVRLAQAQLVEKHADIHLAIDSDLELGVADRAKDQCHLSASGIEKMAAGYAASISKQNRRADGH